MNKLKLKSLLTRSKLDEKPKISNQFFSIVVELFKNFLMYYESQLKRILYDIPLNPDQCLFVVADFAWEKKTKIPETNFVPIFNGRNNKPQKKNEGQIISCIFNL